ncbi:MAG: prepilin-type N-terminal cleavage/methylation domain-containing protein [Deferribacteres bacterium]|nr:prepilin-type N-terminal cleavage/methylation domain-containing protein [Deferribacteres bacterium]
MKHYRLTGSIPGSPADGFTLLEVIIVLIIIGIASGLVGILISRDRGSTELRTFTKDISAVLRYARSQAVSEKKTYCFVIDREDDGYMYRLYAASGTGEETRPLLSKPVPEELEVVMDGNDAATLSVEFFPLGNSSGGAIEIRNRKGAGFLILVNRITGKLKIKKPE